MGGLRDIIALVSINECRFFAVLSFGKVVSLISSTIDPGKPWQSGVNESFNWRFRDECLNMELFNCREEARVIVEDWKQSYNETRPHSGLNYLSSNEFKRSLMSS
jgi:putative transposase